ncbi:uncharacterized protein LOC131884227 isoform X2 [Tigriopus californicus]|uniref:uncharacterized protein LOC131884227 isoform X2 n=1 Tax=Tigriopus californicus TaxID=6832 RepID=UPI0027DA3196|nr:uncharacterized protein LOC131884227 isoform X2 [Tigriopus californicus]
MKIHSPLQMSNYVPKTFRYVHEEEVPPHIWERVYSSGKTPGDEATSAWKPTSLHSTSLRKRQRTIRKITRNLVPEKFKSYDSSTEKLMSFERQLGSLAQRGFLRAFKPYQPPEDVEERFMSVCADVVPGFEPGQSQDISHIALDLPLKAKVLSALEREFQHKVPNSMIHTMTTLDHVFLFYNSRVDTRTPYEKLHESKEEGQLPPNLNIQLNPVRFNPDGDHWSNITAFPGSNTIIVHPENRKKYKDVIWKRDAWEKNAWD